MTYLFPIVFAGIWLIVIISVIVAIANGKKQQKKRDEIYQKIKLEKAADIQTYVNMLTNNKELEQKRKAYKNSKWYVASVIAFVAIICLVLQFFHPAIIIVTVVISIIITASSTSGYSKIYKDQVITSILKNYDKELKYMPNSGITRDIYRTARFEHFDRYHTEDLIAGKISGLDFAIADVHTEDESTDSDGNTTYTTIFRGPVAVIELNKLKDLMLWISTDRIKIFGGGGDYVELENQAFEEKFDLYSNNDVIAMRILTPSLTTRILEMHEKFGFLFEIKLIDGLVFFRFHCDTLFNPNPGDIEKEAFDIAFYFNMLDGMKNIMSEIIEIFKEFER